MKASAPALRSRRAFTLVEIMIVVLIVGLLSALALFAIVRVKNAATEAMVRNNLRQLYQAKEQYFADHPNAGSVTVSVLFRNGYIRSSVNEMISGRGTPDAAKGWHYSGSLAPDLPTFAYHGAPVRPGATPTADQRQIYYPAEWHNRRPAAPGTGH